MIDFFLTAPFSLFGAAFVSLCVALATVLTTSWHGALTLDATAGIQKMHIVPTARVGGVAVMAGLAAACFWLPYPVRMLLGALLVAGLPAFLFGLWEDLTKRVPATVRLAATVASGVLAWLLTGASVGRSGIPGLDGVLALAPAAVLFTAFAVGGVANSMNIIDGANGLAGGTAIISLTALAAIAARCGDLVLAQMCWVACAAIAGFLLVNYPFGKLFLGDGGAYLLGFMVAWCGVLLVHRNEQVSAWAPLLACAYPVTETLFTIVRRLRRGASPFEPDNLHLHSLLKRCMAPLGPARRNALVAPCGWAIAALPAVLAVGFAFRTGALVFAGLGSLVLYLFSYRLAATAVRRHCSRVASVVELPQPAVAEPVRARR